MAAPDPDLEEFRAQVRAWCRAHVPADWRATQTGVSDAEFVAFQQWWFAQLRDAGYAVPHWPARWGGAHPVRFPAGRIRLDHYRVALDHH